METLLTAIGTWLSLNFMLPPVYEAPRIEFGALGCGYDDATRTIHLPAGWTGASPAELAMLVRGMVHHMQNRAGLKYACPEARERLASAAERQWLGVFGRDLMKEFRLDPLTVLVRTNCMG